MAFGRREKHEASVQALRTENDQLSARIAELEKENAVLKKKLQEVSPSSLESNDLQTRQEKLQRLEQGAAQLLESLREELAQITDTSSTDAMQAIESFERASRDSVDDSPEELERLCQEMGILPPKG